MRLAGKVALITGAGRGIGLAIAECFAKEGAAVVVNDRDAAALLDAEAALASCQDRVCAIHADVSRAEEVAALFQQTQDRFGGVDILVNNAAQSAPIAHLLEMTPAFWDSVLQDNLKSAFLCSQLAAQRMVSQGRGGAIVNISSVAATRAHRRMVAYDASKGGIEAATRAMALDLAPWQIRVNAVGPVAIATASWLATKQDADDITRAATLVPLQRLGRPAEVAAAVLFLASAEASFVTGQVLYVDGGMSVQLRPALFE